MAVEFVPMNEQFAKDALALYNAYVLTSTATFSIAPLTQDEMNQLIFTGLDRYPSFAVVVDDEFAGYLLMNRYKPREAYDLTAEVTIYLDEFFHGKGIATKAMAFLEDVAKKAQFNALLGVICAENEASIQLFEKLGYFRCAHFREVGKKFDRLLDVVIYEKLLNEV